MKRAGFTLIELLTVISIIAVLAAILFPVFARAKLSAERTTSLSNLKQIALGEIMYQGDFDDYFVLSTQDFSNSSCPDPEECIDHLPEPSLSWSALLVPYLKSVSLYVDPGTGDPQGYFSGSATVDGRRRWEGYAQYAYNYEFLSPMAQTANVNARPAGHTYGVGRSTSAGVHPAETVMFATSQTYESNGNASTQFETPDDDMANAPGVLGMALDAQDRVVMVSGPCYDGLVPMWNCGWVNHTPASFGGPISANIRVFSPYQGGNFAWTDGHVKSMTAGAITAGTDFASSTPAGGPSSFGSTGTVVTDVNRYLWTLDGTLNDVR